MDSSNCRLLSLPAEIRNTIYRYALVKAKILIQPQRPPPHQPSLLRVSRQLRRETIKIYYSEKLFKWHIRDFNSDIKRAWCPASESRRTANSVFSFVGRCDWNQLLKWLEAAYYKQANVPSGQKPPHYTGNDAAAVQLFNAVRSMRNEQGQSWEEVKANLELIRLTLAAVSSDWE